MVDISGQAAQGEPQDAAPAETVEDAPRVDPWAPPVDGAAKASVPPAGLWAQPGAHPFHPQRPGPYDAPPRLPGVNGLAITSLVTGLTCCLWPAALGFGVAALVQLGRRRQRGRGLAVAGVVLGVLGLLASVLVGVGAVVGFREARAISATVGAAPGSGPFGLRPGDCFTERTVPGGTQRVLTSCAAPHYGEVMSTVTLSDDHFPGAPEVSNQASAVCGSAELSYILDPWARSATVGVQYIYPNTQAHWDSTGHAVLCFLHDSTPGGGSGSLRRDATNLTGDQQAFLQAVTELDAAQAAKPAGDLADHSDRAHWWIQRTAVGMSQAETALGGGNWPDDAKDQVAMMITELQRDQPAWQAAGQDGSTSIDDLASQLAGQDPTLDESVARRALSLAAQPPAPVPTDPQPGTADPSPAVV
ncbi:DUF4190 domain-containing protein [Kitasatospora sp. NBC_01266]|uniref:DUF4190 domain-containing protein n=1 Tax=Kitasatospora sp. NBC_01266 TaxID=2903572 RepID=UPI002E3238B9|nr:DUF4190 domain-containing protein [Kitasatospora sp. NBC_01266]